MNIERILNKIVIFGSIASCLFTPLYMGYCLENSRNEIKELQEQHNTEVKEIYDKYESKIHKTLKKNHKEQINSDYLLI